MINYRSLNLVTLQGRLGADAEIKQTKGGQPYVTFRLATQTSVKDASGAWTHPTTWHSLKFFGPRASKIAPMLVKGATVTVVGQLAVFEKTADGRTNRLVYVNVDDVTGIERPSAQSESAPRRQAQAAPAAQSAPDAYAAGAGEDITYDF